MKRILSILLCAVLVFSLAGCSLGVKKGELGQTYTNNGFEFTLNRVEFAEVIDGWGGANDNYWTPLKEETYVQNRWSFEEYLMQYGLKPKDDDDRIVFVSFTVKNVAEYNNTVSNGGVVKFDNDKEYDDGGLSYRRTPTAVWNDLPSGIALRDGQEDAYEFRAYIIVPKEVVESDKPLTYKLFGITFDLRQIAS